MKTLCYSLRRTNHILLYNNLTRPIAQLEMRGRILFHPIGDLNHEPVIPKARPL
jgi:hypothetical protein